MSQSYKIENPEGIYFLTSTVVGWTDVFTRGIYCDIIVDSLEYCQRHKGLELYAWCLMTNHLHLVAAAQEGYNLVDFTRDFKRATSKKIIAAIEQNDRESRRKEWLSKFRAAGNFNPNNKIYQFWQQGNHPIELWSNSVIDQKIDYVHENPVRAGFVDNPQDWRYSSAKDFTGMNGLLQLAEI